MMAPRYLGEVQLPHRVVSGGQTGVDRAALDVAIALGIAHGGWCPRGRRAEDGVIPERYRLREHASADYAARTEQNVVDSDATLIVARGEPTGGTALTRDLALRHGKPHLVVDLDVPQDPAAVRDWIGAHHVRTLNVAGPRESQQPGVQRDAEVFLYAVLVTSLRIARRRARVPASPRSSRRVARPPACHGRRRRP
jgi:hypothetical protein